MAKRYPGLTVCLAPLLVTAWVGCGGGSSSSPSGGPESTPSAFLGIWNCAGTQVETCGTASHTDPVAFAMTVTQGGASNAITTTPGPFTWMVAGATASLDPTTTPTVPGSVGGTWTPSYASGSLTPSGAALLWSTSGTAVYVNGTTQTCGFTQSYTCTSSAASSAVDAGSDATSTSTLDPTLENSWSYSGQFFYPDPPGTPGIDIVNPPLSLTLAADGSYTASVSGVPLDATGTWFVGATTPADWVQWRQQYNYPEKLTLVGVGVDGVTWDGYVDDGDPSGESMGPPQCLDLFYTESQPMMGYYWLTFCQAVGTKM
jgi:hypothetical protein